MNLLVAADLEGVDAQDDVSAVPHPAAPTFVGASDRLSAAARAQEGTTPLMRVRNALPVANVPQSSCGEGRRDRSRPQVMQLPATENTLDCVDLLAKVKADLELTNRVGKRRMRCSASPP
jgi:hypothetical protein